MVVDGWAEVCGVEPVLAAVVVCAKTNPLAREPTATEYAKFSFDRILHSNHEGDSGGRIAAMCENNKKRRQSILK
jgi:hypothetical protein